MRTSQTLGVNRSRSRIVLVGMLAKQTVAISLTLNEPSELCSKVKPPLNCA